MNRLGIRIRPGVVVAVSAALATLTACSGSSMSESTSGGSEDAVKIGLLLPESGPYADIGEDMRQGFDLRLEELGSELGGRKVEVVAADEGADASVAVPSARKLVQQDDVDVLTGVVSSAVALAIRDLVTNSKVPTILSNAGPTELETTEFSPFIWRSSVSTSQPGTAIGAHVAEAVDGPVYLIGADYVAGREQVGSFKKAFTAAGGEVAGEIYTPFPATQDFQPYLAKIRAAKPAAVYAFYAGSSAVSFVKQYDAFGLKGSISLYGAGFLTEGLLEALGESANEVRTSLNYGPTLETASNEEFVAAYRKAYQEDPTVYAVQSYDAVTVIDEALKDLGGKPLEGDAFVDALEAINEVPSPRGNWEFNEKQYPTQLYYLREVQKDDQGEWINAVLEPLKSVGTS